jgi:hypothetical protein
MVAPRPRKYSWLKTYYLVCRPPAWPYRGGGPHKLIMVIIDRRSGDIDRIIVINCGGLKRPDILNGTIGRKHHFEFFICINIACQT